MSFKNIFSSTPSQIRHTSNFDSRTPSIRGDVVYYLQEAKFSLKKWRTLSLIFAMINVILLFAPQHLGPTETDEDFIAQISIEGMILSDNYRNKKLSEIAKNKHAKALIVEMNSPGGTVTGSEEIYTHLQEIAKTKPVVVVMKEMATSGGYLASLGAQYIIASAGTITGSIGVIMQSPKLSKLFEKLGIDFLTLRTSEFKGEPLMSKESSTESIQALKNVLDDNMQVFSNFVITSRDIASENLSEVLSGKIFSGQRAKDYNLIDAIGSEKDALNWIKTQNEEYKNLPIVDVSIVKKPSPFDLIESFSNADLYINTPIFAVCDHCLLF